MCYTLENWSTASLSPCAHTATQPWMASRSNTTHARAHTATALRTWMASWTNTRTQPLNQAPRPTKVVPNVAWQVLLVVAGFIAGKTWVELHESSTSTKLGTLLTPARVNRYVSVNIAQGRQSLLWAFLSLLTLHDAVFAFGYNINPLQSHMQNA